MARAYVDCSQDKKRGNQQRFNAFWDRVLEHFNVQTGGSDWTRPQVNSKWKNLQKKCNAFNCIYNRRMNNVASEKSEADVLKASLSEYRSTINQKTFPHQKAWEWLKDHAKWAVVTKACEHYKHGYCLADGIYLTWVVFVKAYPHPITDKKKLFKAAQESARNNVERAFGVLKGR
uniref:Uncharacterized protein n=1 Tax=Lactuca sativa TaxID=4236 RepID=A0A9R1XCP5_LACSA|nr:hypothetical protein LSAT_V11C500261760 [Lactuca sativa]